jgi:hypothetical protein
MHCILHPYFTLTRSLLKVSCTVGWLEEGLPAWLCARTKTLFLWSLPYRFSKWKSDTHSYILSDTQWIHLQKFKQWLYRCITLKELVTFTRITSCFILSPTISYYPWNPLKLQRETVAVSHCIYITVIYFYTLQPLKDTLIPQFHWMCSCTINLKHRKIHLETR